VPGDSMSRQFDWALEEEAGTPFRARARNWFAEQQSKRVESRQEVAMP